VVLNPGTLVYDSDRSRINKEDTRVPDNSSGLGSSEAYRQMGGCLTFNTRRC
jgi:hypothetical protein